MFLYNTEHTGLSPYSASCSASESAPQWSYSVADNSNYSSPAIDANGVSYFADYNLYAINPDSTLNWEFTAYGGDTYSSPAIGTDGTIYVGSLDGNLYAITPGGTEKWAFLTTTGKAVESSPAIGGDGTIYVGSDDKNFYAINPNGSLKWAYTTGGAVRSSPAIGDDGTIYVASDDGYLYALTDSGQSAVTTKWAPFPAGAEFYSSPTVGNAGGTIYFSSYNGGGVYAINASTGIEYWEFPMLTSNSSPAIGPDGTIYVGSDDGNLYAITDNLTSAAEKWAFTTGGAVNSSPALGADGTIYVGSEYGYVYAILDNGPDCPSCSPPVTGTPPSEKWPPLAIGTAVNSSPAIGANTSIYFGAGHNLYAQPPGPSKWPATSVSAPGSLDLGSAPVAGGITKTITLENTGTLPMFLLGVTSTDPAEFAETSSTCPSHGTGVAPSQGCTISIRFMPKAPGVRSAMLTLNDNGTTCPQTLAASGTGFDMTVTPASFSLKVKTGIPVVKTVTVTNKQTRSVVLNETLATISGNSGDITVTGGTCTTLPGSTLPAGSSCSLDVTIDATMVGTESATLTVTDSGDPAGPSGYPVSFTVSATVPESLSAKKLSFGKLAQSASETLAIKVTNGATGGPITLTGATLSAPSDFALTGGSCTTLPVPGSLPASSSCTYAVTFAPTTEGGEAGTLSIGVQQDPAGGPPPVLLSGTGVSPLTVTPASLSFGTVYEGEAPANTVTVTNNGGAPLTISEFVSGSTDFAVTPGGTCGTTLAGGGASCTYTVTLTPSTVKAENATLEISAVGDTASPHNVKLKGTAASPLTVTPASLAFGTVMEKTPSTTQTVTVTNNGGAPLTISEFVSGTTDFAVASGVTNGCPLSGSLAVGTPCTYTVTFTPSTAKAETATLEISAVGDTASPHHVKLTGTGASPLTVTPASLAFGTVTDLTASAPQTVTVTNNGGAPLTISEIVIGTTDFTVASGVTNGCPLSGSLAVGTPCTYTVTFTPRTVQALAATLEITGSGDTASPHKVSLTGTGD